MTCIDIVLLVNMSQVQGATISCKVHLDAYLMDFVPASFYVAVSRATSLDNITMNNFKNTGKVYGPAKLFYKGEYKLPPNNVIEVINKKIRQKFYEQPQVGYDDDWREQLSKSLKRSASQDDFLAQVEGWVKGVKRKRRRF